MTQHCYHYSSSHKLDPVKIQEPITMLPNFRLLSINYCISVNPITGRHLIQEQFKKMLTSKLRVPVTQGLLLGRSEVRKVIILVLQGFLIQAKSGKAPGCISSGKDPIWPLLKPK